IVFIYIFKLIIYLLVIEVNERGVFKVKWKREDIIFETIREAEVWAEGVANEMYGRLFDGYETLDYKIAYALSFFLAQERGF
ncbi:hypothetical protein NSP39_23935, partial [Salmonella enterica]|nr:hypothetical protein [Salmonella enterica]